MTASNSKIICDVRIDDDCADLWQNIHPNIIRFVTENINLLASTLIAHDIIDADNDNVDILLSNNANIKIINHEWRGKDKATNILSFPDDDINPDGQQHLGDMMLAAETITDEAVDQNKPVEHHVIHLLLHGLLHLYGYDHETQADAIEMEQLEINILGEIGIDNPYL